MNRHDNQASRQQAPAVMIMPGQWHFGPEQITVKTLLGSCVALTLWHPQRRIGGMCHYLLPDRKREPGAPLQGRFGTEAIELLVNALRNTGTKPTDYIAHLYGGADTMPDRAGIKLNIGERNIEVIFPLIDQHGFQLEGVDVGDQVPRNVSLNVATGEVVMTRGRPCRIEAAA